MINILFSPRWFFGKDILIDVVSVIVLALISYVTFRYYRINKNKTQHLSFSIATGLLALSFIFKIITNFTLYELEMHTKTFGLLTFTYQTVEASNTLFLIGTLLYRFLTLIGFYILFSTYYKEKNRSIYLIMAYFIFVATYFASQAYYIFHLSALLFLLFIVKKYLDNYRRTRDKPAKLILTSFLIILISNAIFIFVELNHLLYVIAEIVQLLGYVMLLISLITVLRYGKKKK